jgi:hypothetical protein
MEEQRYLIIKLEELLQQKNEGDSEDYTRNELPSRGH